MLVGNRFTSFLTDHFSDRHNHLTRVFVCHGDGGCASTKKDSKSTVSSLVQKSESACFFRLCTNIYVFLSDYINSHTVRILCCKNTAILFTCTVYVNVGSVLCVAGSHPAGVPYTNSIFLELKYVFISNILTWLRRFTRCNRLGRAQEKMTYPHSSHHSMAHTVMGNLRIAGKEGG